MGRDGRGGEAGEGCDFFGGRVTMRLVVFGGRELESGLFVLMTRMR